MSPSDVIALIGVAIAFLVALGGMLWAIFSYFLPRAEFDRAHADLVRRLDSLHSTVHDVRNYLMRTRPVIDRGD